ncbi:MAG: Stp1/IreP family PP2C-type Ser/Thr phosphatase [Bdellovibrionota bacterium]
MRAQAFGMTNKGKVRDHNEDFILVRPELGLYIACDGMGGHNAGEVASQMAAETIALEIQHNFEPIKLYSKDPTVSTRETVKRIIDEAIQTACNKIYTQGQANQTQQGMGTTLTLVLHCGSNAFMAHAGDARIYLYRDHGLHPMTQDHSLVNELVQKGMITKEQAVNHPKGNVITRAVGIQEGVEADILHMEMIHGDILLLCSDGLTKHLTDLDLQTIFKKIPHDSLESIKLCAQQFIQTTLDRGALDNVSVVLVALDQEGANKNNEAQANAAKKIETLKRIPLFSELDYQQLMKILEIIEIKSFNAEELVIHEGDKGDQMFILLQGKAQVLKYQTQINLLGPGAYFGEMGLIDDAPRSASVKAIEKTKMIVLSKARLFQTLQSDMLMANKVYWFFLQTLSKRLRDKDKETDKDKEKEKA